MEKSCLLNIFKNYTDKIFCVYQTSISAICTTIHNRAHVAGGNINNNKLEKPTLKAC